MKTKYRTALDARRQRQSERSKEVVEMAANTMKTIQFTKEELKQLDKALGNCWGNGDWLEWLDMQGGKAEEKAFISAWIKLVKPLGQSRPVAL